MQVLRLVPEVHSKPQTAFWEGNKTHVVSGLSTALCRQPARREIQTDAPYLVDILRFQCIIFYIRLYFLQHSWLHVLFVIHTAGHTQQTAQQYTNSDSDVVSKGVC